MTMKAGKLIKKLYSFKGNAMILESDNVVIVQFHRFTKREDLESYMGMKVSNITKYNNYFFEFIV